MTASLPCLVALVLASLIVGVSPALAEVTPSSMQQGDTRAQAQQRLKARQIDSQRTRVERQARDLHRAERQGREKATGERMRLRREQQTLRTEKNKADNVAGTR
ncbi:hypothetical protein [Larsenimonas rhizosphaerae]|uniref:Uncharacterized protein n=1 Tax=Larsenimonas rhizosphaerae TaxID=2944682 RepID=A0AA42CU84_9GAMM|nr:hypothetical protein [Larsenimonas rhizosphaerae]MCM2129748.1 hypothetical protein [Larsenimonas rhizosphaerae]MCX2524407.1 hypothetical protein [Larsenimonas rhizosphaerae]